METSNKEREVEAYHVSSGTIRRFSSVEEFAKAAHMRPKKVRHRLSIMSPNELYDGYLLRWADRPGYWPMPERR